MSYVRNLLVVRYGVVVSSVLALCIQICSDSGMKRVAADVILIKGCVKHLKEKMFLMTCFVLYLKLLLYFIYCE